MDEPDRLRAEHRRRAIARTLREKRKREEAARAWLPFLAHEWARRFAWLFACGTALACVAVGGVTALGAALELDAASVAAIVHGRSLLYRASQIAAVCFVSSLVWLLRYVTRLQEGATNRANRTDEPASVEE